MKEEHTLRQHEVERYVNKVAWHSRILRCSRELYLGVTIANAVPLLRQRRHTGYEDRFQTDALLCPGTKQTHLVRAPVLMLYMVNTRTIESVLIV